MNSNVRIAIVDPGTRNLIEDPQSYFISIRQMSLPVNFRYFAIYNWDLKSDTVQKK